ncbi:peptide chain release factor N(5)-glutamine methyltransferase [Fusobacterium sp. MFO224]|uniref:peptide chain release factor N(5)-glutamine methyltransferase n=1 Tax=Fusobacterium sp. MFO224 TaxID=3378070 RepID=UPI0038542A54
MKLLEIIKFSKEYLEKYSFSKSRLESEKVISSVLGIERINLYSNFEMELTTDEKLKIKKILLKMVKQNKDFDEVIKENKKIDEIPNGKDFKKENLILLRKSIGYLKKYKVPNARLDAEYIFSHVLKIKRNALMLNFNIEITEKDKDIIRKYMYRRGKRREPLQYILKEWEFYGYPMNVDERVLIPRSDTEILVEECIKLLASEKFPKILDIGTGSGAIAISLGKQVVQSEVLGVDISEGALEVANSNKEINLARNVEFLKSDLFENINYKSYDLVVSNPPYIPLEEYEGLMPEVKGYEPKGALTDEGDGYYFYKKITEESWDYLRKGGYLAFEVGYNQGEKVAQMMEKKGYEIIARVSDYGGIERAILGKKV